MGPAYTLLAVFVRANIPLIIVKFFCMYFNCFICINTANATIECITRAKIHNRYSKVGDKNVQIRNLDTDEVFTYYQADVGALPDAIIDIWGEDNIRELAGTPDGAPTDNANNVRYYHERFSDQTAPAR